MKIRHQYINMKEYIKNVEKITFCTMGFFTFDKPDETILVNKKEIKCEQSIEDFIIQSLLVGGCEDPYMNNEIIMIEDERLDDLSKFIFSTAIGCKEKYILNLIENKQGYMFLSEWLSEKDLMKLKLNLKELKKVYVLNKLDSMDQELIFEDMHSLYYLSRGLG